MPGGPYRIALPHCRRPANMLPEKQLMGDEYDDDEEEEDDEDEEEDDDD